jgi:hypothetical protein
MRAGPIDQPLRASQDGGSGGELLHKISESGLDARTWILVEEKQADDTAHQDLRWIQLKTIPGCLPEQSILGAIAPNQLTGNQWLTP